MDRISAPAWLAFETAARDVLVREFGAQRVEFKAGSEFPWLNRSLAAVARLRARTGLPRLEHWANPLRTCLKMLGWFGTDAGGVVVEVEGLRKGAKTTRQIAVTAERNGERIPALLATIVTGALLRGELTARGALPLSICLTSTGLLAELMGRGMRFWLKREPGASWQPLGAIMETEE